MRVKIEKWEPGNNTWWDYSMTGGGVAGRPLIHGKYRVSVMPEGETTWQVVLVFDVEHACE